MCSATEGAKTNREVPPLERGLNICSALDTTALQFPFPVTSNFHRTFRQRATHKHFHFGTVPEAQRLLIKSQPSGGARTAAKPDPGAVAEREPALQRVSLLCHTLSILPSQPHPIPSCLLLQTRSAIPGEAIPGWPRGGSTVGIIHFIRDYPGP